MGEGYYRVFTKGLIQGEVEICFMTVGYGGLAREFMREGARVYAWNVESGRESLCVDNFLN